MSGVAEQWPDSRVAWAQRTRGVKATDLAAIISGVRGVVVAAIAIIVSARSTARMHLRADVGRFAYGQSVATFFCRLGHGPAWDDTRETWETNWVMDSTRVS